MLQPSMGLLVNDLGLAEALLEVGTDGLDSQLFTIGKSSAFINDRSLVETFGK